MTTPLRGAFIWRNSLMMRALTLGSFLIFSGCVSFARQPTYADACMRQCQGAMGSKSQPAQVAPNHPDRVFDGLDTCEARCSTQGGAQPKRASEPENLPTHGPLSNE
jgi:hypothetical protein